VELVEDARAVPAPTRPRSSPIRPQCASKCARALTDADVVHAQVAVVDPIEPKLGADVAHRHTGDGQVGLQAAELRSALRLGVGWEGMGSVGVGLGRKWWRCVACAQLAV